MVKDLIAFGADVNAADRGLRSTLHYLAQSDNNARLEGALKIVGLVIDKEALMSAQDLDGNTPLHLAVPCPVTIRETQKLDVLLKHKPDFNLRNESGMSLLELLIRQGTNATSCHYICRFLDTGVDTSSPWLRWPTSMLVWSQRSLPRQPIPLSKRRVFAGN